jgi:hypothetical protein
MMLNHPSIVEQIQYDNKLIIKLKNPKFGVFSRDDAAQSPALLPIDSQINLNKHINKTVFAIPFCARYGHMLLEGLAVALQLKAEVGLKDLVITAPMPIDQETGLFVHFLDGSKYPYFDEGIDNKEHKYNLSCLEGIKSNYHTIPDFCKYFGLTLTCINTYDFVDTSFDYAYFMYGKFGNFDLGFRFVDPTFTQVIVPKTLIPASFSDYQMVTPVSSSLIHWDSFKLLKDSYPKFDLILGKKTYVSRKNFPDRNVLEEQQIEEYFKSLNYDIVYFENLTILEQVRICQESEKIVCLYGTNLLNCGFCSNKTKVISIKFKIDPLSPTINGFYNFIFQQGNIEHKELEYNGDDLLGFIKEKIR